MLKATIYASRNLAYDDSFEFRLGLRDDKGALIVADPVAFHDHEAGRAVMPFLRLPPEAAQQLMQELWNLGVRPSDAGKNAGALEATVRHLEDMRLLVPGLVQR